MEFDIIILPFFEKFQSIILLKCLRKVHSSVWPQFCVFPADWNKKLF